MYQSAQDEIAVPPGTCEDASVKAVASHKRKTPHNVVYTMSMMERPCDVKRLDYALAGGAGCRSAFRGGQRGTHGLFTQHPFRCCVCTHEDGGTVRRGAGGAKRRRRRSGGGYEANRRGM